jgi:type II secretory pathway predicted ATPase ExeA
MNDIRISDPFDDTVDPACYVPRKSSEKGLTTLLDCAKRPHQPSALLAPPGYGKTLLLHMLATRLTPNLRGVYVPNPILSPEDFCTWTLGQLGGLGFSDSPGVLWAYAAHLAQREAALVWLVDDAQFLPEETADWLGRVLAASGGALRIAVACVDDERAYRTLEALGSPVRIEALASPMSLIETRRYVAGRFERSNIDHDARACCSDDLLREIQLTTGGIPRKVSAEVSEVLRDYFTTSS